MTVSTQPLILVADDEPRITKLVSIALGEEGFRVVTANSGEEALQKAEEIRPDIILLDIVMPDLDGIEVMRQLRERRPVAVILLTAKGSTADKAKGLDLGADDYIAKPFQGIGYLLDVEPPVPPETVAPVAVEERSALIG
jgi:DNA-binding response OmpR family regulator